MGSECIDYYNNREVVVSSWILTNFLQPGPNPDTTYGIPIDASLIDVKFHPEKALLTLVFDRPIPAQCRFRY